MKKLFAIALSACLLAGCASVGNKVDESNVSLIQEGVSNRSDVERLIGKPSSVSTNQDGEVTYVYIYSRAVARGETYIPLVGAFVGGANVKAQHVTVKFNNLGTVKSVETTYTETRTN